MAAAVAVLELAVVTVTTATAVAAAAAAFVAAAALMRLAERNEVYRQQSHEKPPRPGAAQQPHNRIRHQPRERAGELDPTVAPRLSQENMRLGSGLWG